MEKLEYFVIKANQERILEKLPDVLAYRTLKDAVDAAIGFCKALGEEWTDRPSSNCRCNLLERPLGADKEVVSAFRCTKRTIQHKHFQSAPYDRIREVTEWEYRWVRREFVVDQMEMAGRIYSAAPREIDQEVVPWTALCDPKNGTRVTTVIELCWIEQHVLSWAE